MTDAQTAVLLILFFAVTAIAAQIVILLNDAAPYRKRPRHVKQRR